MSYKKILVSVSGAYKEVDASIDGSNLSSSLTITATTASIPLSNGLLAVSGGLLTSITGTANNQVIKNTAGSNQVTAIPGEIYAGSGDLNYSSGKIQVTSITNVESGVLPSLYGGTGTGSFNSGSIVTTNGGLNSVSVPYVLAHFSSSDTVDDSRYGNGITFYNSAITATPVASPFGGNALSCSYGGIDSSNSARKAFVNLKNTQTGDFTLECWAYLINAGTQGDPTVRSIIFSIGTGAVDSTIELGLTSAGVFNLYAGGGVRPSFNISYTPNTWQHLVLVRKQNKVQLFVNGAQSSLLDVQSDSYDATYTTCTVGSAFWGTAINGYISEFAYYTYTKSAKEIKEHYDSVIADTKQRYTRNDSSAYPINDYTLPEAMCNFTAPKTTLTDDSVNANTITYGTTAQITTAPAGLFSSGNALSSSINSAQPTCYITLPQSNINDFTIESWVYVKSIGTSGSVTAQSCIFGGNNNEPGVYIASNSYLTFYDGLLTPYVTNLFLNLNSWNHVVLIRKNHKYKIYLNGVDSSWYNASKIINISSIYIGTSGGGNYNIIGNISEFNYVTYAKSEKQIKDYYNKKAAGTLVRRTSSDSSSEKIITVNDAGVLAYRDKSFSEIALPTYPLAYLYTGGVGSTNTYTWTKPAGCRMIRVICQGGGGGGAKAGTTANYTFAYGGGGGGYSTTIFSADGLPSTVSITAGAGGSGGSGALNSGLGVAGSSGGTSNFGSYLSATGGTGGVASSTSPITNRDGGVGYTYNGGVGSRTAADGTVNTVLPASNVILGGAGGGGGAGSTSGTSQNARPGGSVTALSLVGTTTGAFNALQSPAASPTGDMFPAVTQAIINNTGLQPLPDLVQAGGSGGSSNSSTTGGSGASCSYGSGGGGGSRLPSGASVTNGQGGNGGVGYVLIICY